MSGEHPAINGNGSDPPTESASDPEPINKWDVHAMEELLETIVSKQVTLAEQMGTVETQVHTLRKIVENSINVQLQDRQTVNQKLDMLLNEVSRTFPVMAVKK